MDNSHKEQSFSSEHNKKFALFYTFMFFSLESLEGEEVCATISHFFSVH